MCSAENIAANGTLISPENLPVYQGSGTLVSVSIDGNIERDARPLDFRNGSGSYEISASSTDSARILAIGGSRP